MSNGIFFLDLLSAVEPRVVNWNLVTNGENGTFHCSLNYFTCTSVLELNFLSPFFHTLSFPLYTCTSLWILTLFFFSLWNRWWKEVKCYIHYQCCTKAGLFHFLVTWWHYRGKIQLWWGMVYFSPYFMLSVIP